MIKSKCSEREVILVKWKRLLAMAGVVLILFTYIIAIISAFSHNPEAKNWLMAAVFSSVVIPVFLYAVQLVARVIRQNEDEPDWTGKNKEQEKNRKQDE
jgi:Na+/melibiose symporter-like transporter